MSRMSMTYQCWEIVSGPTVGCKLAHGQTRGLVGQQCVSDGSTLRRHSNPLHESSFPHFAMYLPQHQSDLKGSSVVSNSKDVTVKVSSSSSPQGQLPSTHSSAVTLTSEACSDASLKRVAASETHVTTSSVTTEVDEKGCKSDGLVTSPGGPCEAQSKKRLEGTSVLGGSLSKFQGALPADSGLRVRVPSSKPGVVERIVPLNGVPYGGHVYGSPSNNSLPENSSESSSSICQASDDSGSCTSEDTGCGMEAQSAYRGPLTGMAALDESLPIKRPGLSKFFGGKSRSFASLADVTCVSDLAKPNNPYAYIKRRKMGFNCPLDRHRSYPPPTRSSGASIAKKLPTSGSRNSLAVAVILEGLTDTQQEQQEQPVAAPSTIRTAETRTFPSRSFSLTDLHRDGGSPPPLRRTFVRP